MTVDRPRESETPTMPGGGRMPGLDLLRAIAIAWVMLFHSFVVGGLGADWEWLSRYGWMGVDLFFVLSGFLIGTQVLSTLAHGGRIPFRDFYVRRAFRILPAYGVVLAIYSLWPGFREAPGMEPWWKFAAFYVNLAIDYPRNAAFSHAWSLCIEEHFYLLFPLGAALMMRRPSWRRFASVCALLVMAGVVSRGVVWLGNMQVDPGLDRNWFIEDIYYPTWNRLDGLLCGVVLAACKVFRPRQWQQAQRHADVLLLAGLAVVAASFWLFRDRVGLVGNTMGWPVLSFGLALLVFAGAGRESWIGRRKVFGAGWLAAISYSLYLVHKPVYHLVQARWGAPLAGAGVIAFVVYGLAAVAGGALLHCAVERPMLQLGKRLRLQSRQGATAAVVSGR